MGELGHQCRYAAHRSSNQQGKEKHAEEISQRSQEGMAFETSRTGVVFSVVLNSTRIG